MTSKNNALKPIACLTRAISSKTINDPVVDTNTLIEMIKSKDEKGFHILYNRYSAALHRELLKIVERKDLVDDLLQDSFIKIWKNIESFDPSKGTFFTWMLRITRNQAIDFIRSSRYQKQLKQVELDAYSSKIDQMNKSSSNLNASDFNDFIRKAASHMNQKQAEVIDMIYYYGWTFKQTANMLKIPLGTVKTRVRKGLGIMKILYSNY